MLQFQESASLILLYFCAINFNMEYGNTVCYVLEYVFAPFHYNVFYHQFRDVYVLKIITLCRATRRLEVISVFVFENLSFTHCSCAVSRDRFGSQEGPLLHHDSLACLRKKNVP